MKTEFKDVAHLYIGCPVKWARRNGNIKKDAVLTGADFHWLINKEYLKPILNKLSESDKEFMINEFGLGEFEMANKYYSPKAFLWCLKNNIDLFGLIESGQAIDSPTLNEG